MSEGQIRRRLVAILAADAEGYGRLMATDDRATVAQIDSARAAFRGQIEAHNGRVIDMAGDSILAVFDSAIGAVAAGLAVQRDLGASHKEVPEHLRMRFRIGVHLGDVIEAADGTVYGNGVNIAARLQALSEAGGITVSDAIHEAVRGKVAAVFVNQGEQDVKNIPHRVRAYSVQAGDRTAPTTAALSRVSPPFPDRPSVAVLPFTNMSGEADQEYFSDGISEDLVTDLSKMSGLTVIASNSSFAYKLKNLDIRAVGRELGVGSVLAGSIRRAGNRVRIAAQLVDTATGAHLWAERYDRDLTDIFVIQDEVARQIVGALSAALLPAELVQPASIRTVSIDAHDRFLWGRELMRGSTTLTREIFDQSVAAYRQAVELDSGFAAPYAGLAILYTIDYQNRLTDIPDALDRAADFAAQAVRKGPHEPDAHFAAAVVAIWKQDLVLAQVETDRTLALNPNHAMAYCARGNIEVYLGNPQAGIPSIQRGMLLDPFFTHQNLHFLGTAYLVAGQFDAAVAALRERIRLAPTTDLSRAFLVSALGHLGQLDEARCVWSELKEINPKYSLAEHLARLPFQGDAGRDGIRAGVTKAGLSG